MKRLLVLRPEPGASATVEKARQRGLEPLSIPLFEIEAVAWQAPEAASFDGLLLTSANAARCGGEQLASLRGLPVHAVGKATAEAAHSAGFDVASTGEAGVDRLLASLEPDLRLLHLCGLEHRIPTDVHQQITRLAVYRSRPKEAVELAAATGAVALIHSPRAGERFSNLVDQAGIDRGSIAIVAISEAAADAAGDGWAAIEASEHADDDALLALAERLCNKSSRE